MVSIGQIVEIKEESSKSTTSEQKEISSENNFSNKTTQSSESSSISKFRVRVPFLHGKQGEASAVPDNMLPEATFCALPGSEETKLNNGDLVYVAVVDFDFSKIVIIGFVSADQASSSNSGASLARIQKLEMAENGSAKFSGQFEISDGTDTVDWENIKSLTGFNHRLEDWVWPIENGGTGKSISKDLPDDKLEEAQKEVRDNFGIFTTKIVSSTEFEKIQKNNKYEKNTIYYIWDDEEE